MSIPGTARDVATPTISPESRHSFLENRLRELFFALTTLGESTPPPFNHPHSLITRDGSSYIIRAKYNQRFSYYLPEEIAPDSTPQEQRNHRELIHHLNFYFEIKDEITSIQTELRIL